MGNRGIVHALISAGDYSTRPTPSARTPRPRRKKTAEKRVPRPPYLKPAPTRTLAVPAGRWVRADLFLAAIDAAREAGQQ